MRTILVMPLGSSADALLASRRTREIAGLLDLAPQDRTRLGGAVTEVVEGALSSGSTGTLEFALESTPGRRCLAVTLSGIDPRALMRVTENGAAPIDLERVRRLVDRVDARGDGSTAIVEVVWELADDAFLPSLEVLARAVHRASDHDPSASVEELRRRNLELVQTLATLQTREAELLELNRALEDTNAGIVGLLGELDRSSADALRRADEPATRFLRAVSHELRTPLYAARGLLEELALHPLDPAAREDVVLLDRTVEEALTIVNDQLELLRLHAGRAVVRVGAVDVDVLLRRLRGTLRVLRRSAAVELVVVAEPGLVVETDEGKLSQILRNLISNALKFTEAGEVRVTATASDGMVWFVVSDTGIGLAPADLERIFEEFQQVQDAQPEGVSSSGLGLPLARSLAELLGGSLTATSVPGVGSEFSVAIPLRFDSAEDVAVQTAPA